MNSSFPDSEVEVLKARVKRLEALQRVAKVIYSTLDLRDSLQRILSEAVGLVNGSSGSVCLLNPTTGLLEIEAHHGLSASAAQVRLRLGQGITGWVARSGQSVRVGDVARDNRYINLRPEVRSELALPLHVDGTVRGVLNVDSDRPEAFTADDQQLLEDFAALAEPVIRNTWIYESARQKAKLLESLVSVGQVINSSLSLDEALRAITREARTLIGARMCSLMMVDESGEWLDLRAHSGAGNVYVSKPRLSVSESLLGIVIRRRKPIQVADVRRSARYQNIHVAKSEGLVSLLTVPLMYAGKATGTLNIYTERPHIFADEEVRTLAAYAELSALALEKARLYERTIAVEEALRQSERLSALGLLAAEIAHEIRNPLTVMKMLHHSLDLNFDDDDPRRTDVRIMGEKMDHLNRIVDQVLDFARRTEPSLEGVNVNQLLDDLALLTRHKLKAHGVELTRRLDKNLPTLMGDATQLEQAFLNLTLNAVEAMPQGGRLTICSRAFHMAGVSQPASHVVVQFRDTGVGMTPDQQARAFTSLLNTTKARGTGIGLAIVARVVETHQGKVRVWSKLGLGSTITLIMPVSP